MALRVVLGALGGLVGLVAVLGAWQVLAARDSQRSQILGGELTAARLASKTVASAVQSRLQLLDNLANQPGSTSLVTPAPTLDQIVVELLRLYPQFSSISLLDAAGNVLAAAPAWPSTQGVSGSRRASFAGVLRNRRSYVTGAFEAPTGGLAVTLGAPVRDSSGTIAGVVQASVPVASLSAAVGGSNLRGGGALVIVDQDGHAITGPAAKSMVSYSRASVVALALGGKSGTATAAVPGFKGGRLAAYAPVGSIGWAVVVENPVSVLDGPVAALTERLVGIGAAVLVFAIAAAIALWTLLRQLAQQRDEVDAIFSSVGEGVATLSADGRVLRTNPALDQLTGRSGATSWSEAFVLLDESGEPVSWERSVAAEAIRRGHVVASHGFALSLQDAEGRKVPVALTASALFVDSATPSGAVVVFRDVSREHEVDQLKSSLVSTVSHELRTPLTLIQGFCELLLTRTNLDPVQSHEALTQIHASSQRLGRLIDDLLSVSRMESGRLSAEVETIDMAQIVSEVVSSFAVDHDHHFSTELAPSMVLADRDKVVQVLTNLVSNAVKYSPTGSEVQVTVSVAGDDARVDVIDHGIGMSAEESASVFEKFSRSNRPEVRKVGGTGLGLYITKNLVELQGGQLWMQSEPGRGSTFTFTLPLAQPGSTPAVASLQTAGDQ